MKQLSKKSTTIVIFILYLLFLTWLILFKMAFLPGQIPHRRVLNLVLFKGTTSYHGHITNADFWLNILVFVPFGYYVMEFFKEKHFLLRTVVTFISGVLLSVLFETIQYIFSIGGSDITDVFTNAIGTLLGIVCVLPANLILKKKSTAFANILLIFCEIAGVAFGLLKLYYFL